MRSCRSPRSEAHLPRDPVLDAPLLLSWGEKHVPPGGPAPGTRIRYELHVQIPIPRMVWTCREQRCVEPGFARTDVPRLSDRKARLVGVAGQRSPVMSSCASGCFSALDEARLPGRPAMVLLRTRRPPAVLRATTSREMLLGTGKRRRCRPGSSTPSTPTNLSRMSPDRCSDQLDRHPRRSERAALRASRIQPRVV